MSTNELIKILENHCDAINTTGKHIKCYPTNSDSVIIVSKTASDTNYLKQVYRDFRRVGIIIPELNK